MSIYGDPIIMGKAAGGGGGGGNAYASLDAPSASAGDDGEYWFQLNEYEIAMDNDFPALANTKAGGWEFVTNDDFTVDGVTVFARVSETGTVKIGTTGGAILQEISISLVANQWSQAVFDEPLVLEKNNNIVIMVYTNGDALKYAGSSTSKIMTTSKISYVRGRYSGNNAFPGTNDANTAYSVNLLYGGGKQPLKIYRQYYKTGGVWVTV